MGKPELTFFCELPSDELTELFDGRFLIDDLNALDASLSLGLLDLSANRAQVVKRLNKASLPVIAWLLLPKEDGYWFNIENFEKAAARYVAFKTWTKEHDLQWAGVGVDIEMDINDLRQMLAQEQGRLFVSTLFHRYMNKQRIVRGQYAYQALIELIHADGYLVESYHLPLISEERRASSTVLQRIVGLVDLKADREVLMLYSSFLRPHGAELLWSYASESDSVGVGITGGGVDIAELNDLDPLTWEEFARDLRLCMMKGKPIHIFSLEGCVEQGFLSKLNQFDWDQPVDIPAATNKINAFRTGIAAGLWLLERPWVILIAIATFVSLGFLFKHNKRH